MLRTVRLGLPLLCFVLLAPSVTAQPAERTSPLSVEQIMQDPETWVGDWPENVRWHENGQTLYFDWNPDGDFPSDSLYKVSRSGGEPQKVSPEERRSNPPTFDGWHHGEHIYTDAQQRKLYAADGDLYLYNRETDTQTRLTDTRAYESEPRFDPDGERVIFERDDNLFALTLSTGLVRQLTDLRSGPETARGRPVPPRAVPERAADRPLRDAEGGERETKEGGGGRKTRPSGRRSPAHVPLRRSATPTAPA